ncbi:MAG: DNA topoisomerase I [Candidatus Micrarchaeia archaeon]
MNELIVAEKPSVAIRIALSLSEGQPKRGVMNGIGYYEVNMKGKTIYVVAAAGHLFTLHQKKGMSGFPVFDVEWVPSYAVNKNAYYTKKYLDTITAIGKKCDFFINACDYDLEGTVIGTNIIKQIINNDVNRGIYSKNVGRMKFSTTTTGDLLESYKNMSSFDALNFEAGETRHVIDWIWGINMSRALMHSLVLKGLKKTMSIGRVQGPTLGMLAKREIEIKNFVPKPFWQVYALVNGVEFANSRGEIFDKKVAETAYEKSRNCSATVKEVERSEAKIRPYPPFNLTGLQLEASKVLGIDPSRTLAIAQSLYEKAYISYPRTSSQKLPYVLNLPRIIAELGKNKDYAELANALIRSSMFKPAEGAGEDEAHPAIFPTGVMPKGISGEEYRVYDLIARRFLSCFAGYATAEDTKVVIDANGELYSASGRIYKEKAWLNFYSKYIRLEEKMLDGFRKGDAVKIEKLRISESKTKPPKRYTKASLIAMLDKKNLGTKATRSEIIDILFKREYIKNREIVVTEFGMGLYNALSKYCSEILDEELTRKLELDMDNIAHGKLGKEAVIDEAKRIIGEIVEEFKRNEQSIGEELMNSFAESQKAEVLGKCPKCGGDLVVRRSKLNKLFVGCTNWPDCTVTYPLPQKGKIVPTGKVCEICHTPIIKVFVGKGKVYQMDLDPNCETKKDWKKKVPEEKKEKPAREVYKESSRRKSSSR